MTAPKPSRKRDAELVRCIACRTIYAKPTSIRQTRAHVNCPECGYVGWLSVDIPIDPQPLRQVFERFTS